jgi:hypothetical protein
MKKILFIILFIPVLTLAQSKLEGYSSPKAAIEAITKPLKQGSKGVVDSVRAMDSLNGDAEAPKYENIKSTLTKELKENGKLVKTTLVESDDAKLNGYVQVHTYQLEYANGRKREVQIKLIKPSEQAGFHIMGVTLDP